MYFIKIIICHVLMYSFIVVCDFNPTERKRHIRENWLVFWGIWGEAGLILGICEARQNTFRELRKFRSGIWGDQCIILREQGSTDSPLGVLKNTLTDKCLVPFLWDIGKLYRPRSDAAKRGI